ncbi:hypothetical protein KSP40_PGU005596 [Platanthera guangdongensis]|uniref:Uncharacterized protein n=1 Tax=Platanthera guangdongensis TaxID=2320717 RepID=A0ABR2MR42_9ASPA
MRSDQVKHPYGDFPGAVSIFLWFDPALPIPPLMRCFAEQMKLTYDASIDDSRNAPIVQTHVNEARTAIPESALNIGYSIARLPRC